MPVTRVHIPSGKQVAGPPDEDHYYKCPKCGGWVDCRDLMAVVDYERPLPHDEYRSH